MIRQIMLTDEGWWRVVIDRSGNVQNLDGPYRWRWLARLSRWRSHGRRRNPLF